MKQILSATVILMSFMVPFGAQAMDHYDCRGDNGTQAMLKVKGHGSSVEWTEPAQGGFSNGIPAGTQMVPHSEWIGFDLYKLTGFPSTAGSGFMLAVEPVSRSEAATISVVRYIDDDGRYESIVHFFCKSK